MRPTLVLIALLIAAPAFAQSGRIYTNADLGHPLAVVPDTRLTPADAAAILFPGQFVYLPSTRTLGPQVYVVGSSSTAGPFGEFPPFPAPRRLDGSSYADPPWSMSTYLGRQGFRGSRSAEPVVTLSPWSMTAYVGSDRVSPGRVPRARTNTSVPRQRQPRP